MIPQQNEPRTSCLRDCCAFFALYALLFAGNWYMAMERFVRPVPNSTEVDTILVTIGAICAAYAELWLIMLIGTIVSKIVPEPGRRKKE